VDVEVEGEGVWLPLPRPAEEGVAADWPPLGAGVPRLPFEVPTSGSVLTSDDISQYAELRQNGVCPLKPGDCAQTQIMPSVI